MHIGRLTALADLLDVTAPEKFRLATWHCGTTACAIGTAALHPDFNRQGLHLRPTGLGYTLVPFYDRGDGRAPLETWKAVEAFFDLSLDQALHLFSARSYWYAPSEPAAVADRIRELISQEKP